VSFGSSGFFIALCHIAIVAQIGIIMYMDGIIDFHTHAFPDELAERAMQSLQHGCDVKAQLDGKISSLLTSMDSCGIETSVVCSIATKPSQFDPILKWSDQIRTGRIIPLPSVHPDDANCIEHIRMIKAAGFKGVKMHPFYQDFFLDEPKMLPLYEKICEENLILMMHTGFDIAFERIRRCDPAKIAYVVEKFPALKIIATHLGAWQDWNEVQRLLIGRPIYMELSMSLEYLEPEIARNMILAHPADYVLFGSDSPWTSQQNTLAFLRQLQLGDDREKLICRQNALRLLSDHI
jgi:predicted TIM-barrel fold metal-dependent hydrolase